MQRMRNNRRSFLLREFPSAALASAAAWSGLAQEHSAELVAHNAPLDIGHFARVTTSDAARVRGARAARTEEFRADDLFLETDVPVSADGNYVVPVAENGLGCIGLVWVERRPIRMLELGFPSTAPPPDGVRVQVWVGNRMDEWGTPTIIETLWQGHWVPLSGQI